MLTSYRIDDLHAGPAGGLQPLHSGAFARVSPGAVKLAANPAARTVTAVISTVERDRAGDVVVPRGLRNAAEYLRNPVVLWAHNRSTVPPIGTCLRLDVQPDRIVAETKFAEGVPLAEDLFRLYERKVGQRLPKDLRRNELWNAAPSADFTVFDSFQRFRADSVQRGQHSPFRGPARSQLHALTSATRASSTPATASSRPLT
jgi:hypothetical protein